MDVIPSTEPSLVTTVRYVSPVYIAEFDRVQKGTDVDRPDNIIFKEVEEDNIIKWLENNSLCKLREPFPGHYHSDTGYLFMSKEGAHIVSPKYVEVNPISAMSRTTQDKTYEARLTIRSQPVGTTILGELANALEERNFREVAEFDN